MVYVSVEQDTTQKRMLVVENVTGGSSGEKESHFRGGQSYKCASFIKITDIFLQSALKPHYVTCVYILDLAEWF